MNYLALHIDTDFLVGTICADEGNFFYPIINGNDECFWLYFYNDPYSGNISFGKDNQRHCNKGETNYIGNFIELIENENNTFQVGAYEYPIIELLRYSKILDILKTNFITQTYESQENIPTLLTFSLSIKDLAKKTIVDFLKKQGFDIISYTIPLSELACKYSIMNNRINFANGNIVTFLEATNTNLHLVKLIFTTDYFLSDGDSESNQGLGIDPRRRAILKFVVNKIGTMGHLSSEQKEIEYKLLEPKTIDWLNDLDMQTNNAPFPIIESLSKMPNHKKRVLVYKDKLSEFTQSDIKLIVDTYKDFVNRNISQDVSSIVLLGSLFQNEIIQNKFQSLIPNDRLFVYSNRDIQNILSIYPKIDFNRYTSEQGRIEAKAIADKQRKAEELAKEIAKAKVEKDAKDKAEAEAKKDIEKQKGRILYDQALALEKEERLEEALLNIKDAILLDPERIEYSRFRDHLNVKTKELNVKTEKYKSWYKDAECYEQSGELDLALKAYKNAQEIFDLAELRKKIVKLERDIEKQQVLIVQLVSEASTLVQNKKFDTAKDKIDAILAIDSSNVEAKKLLTKINEFLKQQEKLYNDYIKSADKHFNSSSFTDALDDYKQALSIRPDNTYCLQQIDEISDTIQKQKENKEKCEKIMEKGDALFQDERWIEAQSQYQLALNLCPEVKSALTKLNECNSKIKEQEDTFTDLLLQANLFVKRGKLKDALEILENAKKIRPDNDDIKNRIKKVKFELEFGEGAGLSGHVQKSIKSDPKNNDDFWGSKPTKVLPTRNNDDFLGIKATNSTSPKKPEEDDFFTNKSKKTKDEDDFLGLKKIKK